MSQHRAALLSQLPVPPLPARRSPGPGACLAVALGATLLFYLPTASGIVHIWMRSPTFNHGFMIFPVAGWMIWRQRASLLELPRGPWLPALLPLAGLGFIWMLSEVANVQVLQQYCLLLMCIATASLILGSAIVGALAFPLAYTLLAVPFGEVLIAPLIEFTARFTVAVLQLGGIPVFHENNYISLPTGNWAVADACSGLRYLIASFALGMIYAYVNYRATYKRMLFVVVAIILPVLANGMRACLIVLIGHWSNMRFAAGVDHLVYGWLFFGLVMAVLFWCGAYWRDAAAVPPGAVTSRTQASTANYVRLALMAVALNASWPLLAAIAVRPATVTADALPELRLAMPPAPWQVAPLRPGDWQVLHRGQPQRVANNYSDGKRTVSLQIFWYPHQSQGAELLAPVRRTVVSGMPQWEEVRHEQRHISVNGRAIRVCESVQQAANYKMLVWHWYRQDGTESCNPYVLKLLLAKAKLSGSSDAGAEITLASAYDEQPAQAAAALLSLLTAMQPAIDESLRHVNR